MSETKTCQNCKHWVERDKGIIMGNLEFELCLDKQVCDKATGIITYHTGWVGRVTNDSRYFMVTEPDFGCTKFEPKGDLK